MLRGLRSGSGGGCVKLEDYAGFHSGQDIYVLGSGSTLAHVDRGFFANKVTIGCNLVWKHYVPTTYTVTKYHEKAAEGVRAADAGTVFVSRKQHGRDANAAWRGDGAVVFNHLGNKGWDFDAEKDWPENGLVVSKSTITSAMHLAAYMGAATILMVGADCGFLDGDFRRNGYPDGKEPDKPSDWFDHWDLQNRAVKAQLVARYGVRVYSLNPFINYNLEGHRFRSGYASINL